GFAKNKFYARTAGFPRVVSLPVFGQSRDRRRDGGPHAYSGAGQYAQSPLHPFPAHYYGAFTRGAEFSGIGIHRRDEHAGSDPAFPNRGSRINGGSGRQRPG